MLSNKQIISSVFSPQIKSPILSPQEFSPLSNSLSTTNSVSSKGFSGFEILGYKVNEENFSEDTKNLTTKNLEFTASVSQKIYKNVIYLQQDLSVKNTKEIAQTVNTSILVQINYDFITWNGTTYDLTKYNSKSPLILRGFNTTNIVTGKQIGRAHV